MVNNRETGRRNELLAASYLEKQGYTILEHNFYGRHGEIDLIAKDGVCLVFVEVKYRKNDRYGQPWEAITPQKLGHLKHTALTYLMKHDYSENTPCRFDVVSIMNNHITLYKNAFSF